MRVKLTAVAIPSLPKGLYHDTISEVILQVGINRKTWMVRYRKGGRRFCPKLGYFPKMTLSQARDAAAAVVKRAEAGLPTEVVNEPVHHSQSPKVLTVGRLLDRYEAMRRKKGGRGTRSLDLAMRTVRSGLKDYLEIPAVELNKAGLRAARDEIAKRAPFQANRFLSYLGPVWRWASAEDLVPVNFVPDVLKAAAEVKRERVLTDGEVKAIWHAALAMSGRLRDAQGNFGKLVCFLLLTGQRRSEGALLKHGAITHGVWRQRPEDNKPGRAHQLRLPPLAVELVGSGGVDDYVFAGARQDKPLSGFSKLKAELDKMSGVSDWRIHDLRRTAASGMQALGVPPHIITAILNHAVPGVAGVYLRAELEAEKAEALKQWANHVSVIVKKTTEG